MALKEPFEKECVDSLLGIMVSSNRQLFESIKNKEGGVMNKVLREFFKEEIQANEEQAKSKWLMEGRKEGWNEGRIEGEIKAYNNCNMPVSEIAKKVSKSEEYVKEVIKKLSAACL